MTGHLWNLLLNSNVKVRSWRKLNSSEARSDLHLRVWKMKRCCSRLEGLIWNKSSKMLRFTTSCLILGNGTLRWTRNEPRQGLVALARCYLCLEATMRKKECLRHLNDSTTRIQAEHGVSSRSSLMIGIHSSSHMLCFWAQDELWYLAVMTHLTHSSFKSTKTVSSQV